VTPFDKYLGYFILGPIAPVLLLLAGWWGSLLAASEYVSWFAVGGLAIGCTLDLLVLPHWVNRFYTLSPLACVLIYLFYSIGIYGFFMGFPVFNVLPGVIAGIYVGRRYLSEPTDEKRRVLKHTSWFSTLVIVIICCSSAWLAINEATMPSELQGMLRLPFTVTWTMIYWLIGVGGTLLIAAQYLLTHGAGKFTFSRSQ